MASERPKLRQLGGELVIPVIAICFTLYFFTTIWNSPWTAQVSAFSIGGVLLFVCLLFFVKSAVLLRRGEATLGFGSLFGVEDVRTGRVWLFAATVIYCVFLERLGFTLATFLFLAASMMILAKGRRPFFVIAISAAMALGGWSVFILAFDTRFPRGWFEDFMRTALSNG